MIPSQGWLAPVWVSSGEGPCTKFKRGRTITTLPPDEVDDLLPPPPHAAGPTINVDPPTPDGNAHHPLILETNLNGVNVTPLITSGSPIGYTPTQIKSYLGLTGTGSGQTIAIVTAYNAPTIAADLATFDTTFHVAAGNTTRLGVITLRDLP